MEFMKFKYIFLIVGLLVVALVWYFLTTPQSETIDIVLSGYMFSSSGASRTSTVKIKGSYRTYIFKNEMDQFIAGYDGGFWIDGYRLNLSNVGFFYDESNYSFTGNPEEEAIVQRGMKSLIVNYMVDGENALVVAPATSKEDAINLLLGVPVKGESEDFKKVYDWVLQMEDRS